MKKFSIALLKASVLLFSFSAIALALILRDQIGYALMAATIAVAIILIIIIIVLLVNEEPEQTNKKNVREKIQSFNIEDDEPVVKKVKPVSPTPVVDTPTATTTQSNTKRKWKMIDSGDLLYIPIENETFQSKQVVSPVVPTEPVETTMAPEVQEESAYANPYNIQLYMTDEDQDNLVSVIEDMEAAKLIHRNSDYDNYDLLPRGVKYYQSAYKDIPIITIIKQRHKRHKVMAGCNASNLYQIATFEEKDHDLINTLYNHSQHMQGIISGGRYRYVDIDTDEAVDIFEPQSVQLRIYHTLS